MARIPKCSNQAVITLYTEHHHTMEEIAARYGITRQAVHKRLKAAGISTQQGEKVECLCDQCGKGMTIHRGRWRAARGHYCSRDCFNRSLIIPGSWRDRQGMRRARILVGQYFDLQPDHIVHHKDGDQSNNDIKNLRVYANHAHHLRAHRGFDVPWLWDGEINLHN